MLPSSSLHAHTHICMHAHTHTHTHTRARAHTHTHTHTHTETHIKFVYMQNAPLHIQYFTHCNKQKRRTFLRPSFNFPIFLGEDNKFNGLSELHNCTAFKKFAVHTFMWSLEFAIPHKSRT